MITWTRHHGLALLLVLGAVLGAGPVAFAHSDPPAPPGAGLVPGLVPVVPSGREDTVDQVLPPFVYRPSAGEDSVEPSPPAGGDELVEFVPPGEVVDRNAAAAATTCTKKAGPHQRAVERWLKRRVDGKQSAADCKAIRAFQIKQKIKPANGFAGPVTWGRMRLLSARPNPNAAGKCPVRAYRVACVDQARQLMWVQKSKKVVYGPVPIRSGRAGYRTRNGWHSIYWKHKNHFSTIYNVPMPYSQFFSGGQAFHASSGSLYSPTGSRGCVNLGHRDAQRLWDVLLKGDRVYIWGKRPGS